MCCVGTYFCSPFQPLFLALQPVVVQIRSFHRLSRPEPWAPRSPEYVRTSYVHPFHREPSQHTPEQTVADERGPAVPGLPASRWDGCTQRRVEDEDELNVLRVRPRHRTVAAPHVSRTLRAGRNSPCPCLAPVCPCRRERKSKPKAVWKRGARGLVLPCLPAHPTHGLRARFALHCPICPHLASTDVTSNPKVGWWVEAGDGGGQKKKKRRNLTPSEGGAAAGVRSPLRSSTPNNRPIHPTALPPLLQSSFLDCFEWKRKYKKKHKETTVRTPSMDDACSQIW